MTKSEKAIFGAGCFWGVEEIFFKTPGVLSTRVGYAGGHTNNPTYEKVCTDKTGHCEAVEILYNTEKISYKQLLDIFFSLHNPTTANRQGLDIGSQYRSAIFYLNKEQMKLAQEKIKELERTGKYASPIVTEINPATEFFPAEEYHQKYFLKHPYHTCR